MARDVELAIDVAFEAADAVAGMDDVGDAARNMGDAVDDASRTADAATDRMGSIADSADNLGSSTSQAAGGLGDLGGALSAVPGPLGAVGSGMESLAPLVMGVTGATDLMNLAMNSNIVVSARARAASVAQAVSTRAVAVANRVAAVGQLALNAAMSANPLGLVIIALVAVAAAIVIAYNKSETFRKVVDTALGAVKTAFQSVMDKVDDVPPVIQGLMDKVDDLPGVVDDAKRLVVNGFELMTAPIRTVIDLVEDLIGWIDKIDFPDLPDLPGLGRSATGGSSQSGITRNQLAGAGGVTLVSLEVNNGVVGNTDALGRDLIQILRRAGVSIGGDL